MLSIVLLWIVMYLSGTLICKISGEKETSQLWKQLIGFFFLICCQGVIFFAGQLLGWNFRKTGNILAVVFLLVSLVALFLCRKELGKAVVKMKAFHEKKIKVSPYGILLTGLFVGIVLVVALGTVVNREDAVAETVVTTLMTDTMNQYHPFTGKALEMGVITSRKIITLPFWYSILSVWTGMDGVTAVWILGTVITIFCSLLAYGELGGLLFFRDKKKMCLLLILIELLYLSGDYYVGTTGYRQLYYGYSGEVIVTSVIIPCVLSILYRFLGVYIRADFPVEQEKLTLWGTILELGLCVGCCLFLIPMVWGICMVIFSIFLFSLSVLGVRLSKRKREVEG